MIFSRQVLNDIYSRRALAVSREAYHLYCNVRAQPQNNGIVNISVQIKEPYKEQARQVFLEFWNYFLDVSCKQYLETV